MKTRLPGSSTRPIVRLAGLLCLLAVLPTSAAAQSAQQFSLQFSGLGAIPFGDRLQSVEAGIGWEAQVRVNPSAFSIGVGAEQTFHTIESTTRDMTFLGGFIEPRYVIDLGSDIVVLYLSARAAVSQVKLSVGTFESTGAGYTLNGGGGLLFPLGNRVNLDVGATVGYKDLGVLDLPTGTLDLETGGNVVGRIGLAIGLG